MATVIYDRVVSETSELSPEQARAALQEADSRAAQVRRSDLQLAWMLLVLAGAYLGLALLFSAAPHRGNGLPAVVILVILTALPFILLVIGLRIRAYTRSALKMLGMTLIGFNVWNAVIAAVSIGSRFWASTQPSYNLDISVAIAVIPLLVGAAIIWRRAP